MITTYKNIYYILLLLLLLSGAIDGTVDKHKNNKYINLLYH